MQWFLFFRVYLYEILLREPRPAAGLARTFRGSGQWAVTEQQFPRQGKQQEAATLVQSRMV